MGSSSPVVSTQYAVHSTPQPQGPRTLPFPRLVPALLTGGLLYICYFPLHCGWLAWVALVPLLVLVRSAASKKRLFFCAWAGGLAFFVPVLQWMRVAHPSMYATWLGLAIYCALYAPIAVLLLRYLDRRTRWPLVVTLPVVWVALEILRSHLMTGFSWYLLGHSQHDFLPLIQITDLGGVYTVSILIAAVNALLFEVLYARPWFRTFFALPEPIHPSNRRMLLVHGVAVALLLAGTLVYGGWRMGQDHFAEGPRVALVQSNVSLTDKNVVVKGGDDSAAVGAGVMEYQIKLTDLAASRKPDLIVWAETSWPAEWHELLTKPDGPTRPVLLDSDVETLFGYLTERWHTDLLPGMNTSIITPDGKLVRRYNSAILLHADGTFAGRYDKIHCVPFGEYIPLRDTLPFMKWFSPYDFDYSVFPGEGLPRFRLGRYHYGILICYEDTISDLGRQYALPDSDQPAADFLLNTSNDGWFDGTAEHAQHLAMCRFRAIEARRSVARCVNMGISAVVDPNGRVLPAQRSKEVQGMQLWEVNVSDPRGSLPVSKWSEFQTVPGVLIAAIPIDNRVSLYARLGDWLPWGCWLIVAAGVILGFVRGRRNAGGAAN